MRVLSNEKKQMQWRYPDLQAVPGSKSGLRLPARDARQNEKVSEHNLISAQVPD